MHAATSAVVALLVGAAVRSLLHRRGVSTRAARRLLGPTLCWAGLVSAVGTLGVLWEVAEWAGHRWITEEIGVGYADTVGDLAANLVGAGAASAAVARAAGADDPRLDSTDAEAGP